MATRSPCVFVIRRAFKHAKSLNPSCWYPLTSVAEANRSSPAVMHPTRISISLVPTSCHHASFLRSHKPQSLTLPTEAKQALPTVSSLEQPSLAQVLDVEDPGPRLMIGSSLYKRQGVQQEASTEDQNSSISAKKPAGAPNPKVPQYNIMRHR